MDWPGIFKPELCTDYKLWPVKSAVRGLTAFGRSCAGFRPIQTRNLLAAFMQA